MKRTSRLSTQGLALAVIALALSCQGPAIPERVHAPKWQTDMPQAQSPTAAPVQDGPAKDAPAGDRAAEMARKLQNPLASIRALMTDNAILAHTGKDEGTSYRFALQPVYAMDFPEHGFTFLPRAVLPIMGLEPGTSIPPVGDPVPPGNGSTWGLGDTVLQAFIAPHTDAKWKWGVGPQISLATATDSDLSGPDWGAGISAVVTGGITKEITFAGIVGNLWAFDGNFNTMTLQPMVFYNIPSMPGTRIGYNAVISADWEATSKNRWTVPLGFTVGRTFDLGGTGLDLGLGPYYNVVAPDGAASWQLRFGINFLF